MFCWQWKSSDQPRVYGVGFTVRNSLLSMVEPGIGGSSRLLMLLQRSGCNQKTSIAERHRGTLALIIARCHSLVSSSNLQRPFVKEFDASQPGDLVTNFEVLSLASLPQLVHYTQTAQIASAGPHLSHGRMAASLKTSCMESCQLVGRSTGHAQLRYEDVCKRDVKATQHQRSVLGGPCNRPYRP